MAEYLASIFGTEKDKVNCSFYFKIGACRHGDRCSRIHNKPTFSQTCLLQNLYVNPQNSAKSADGSHLVANVSDEEMQEHYDNFFEDVFVECEDKYGEIEEMNVCDNLGDHLVGNVYIKFRREEDADRAVNDLNNRWFGDTCILEGKVDAVELILVVVDHVPGLVLQNVDVLVLEIGRDHGLLSIALVAVAVINKYVL
ncbi:hypothetical protein NQ314_002862 [Rhamnusium bicolor]|uniref:Splicing factor U2af 38 kDa subunit n=1 Tax=Rhamnusium bicolor TaxID=1586634 RepID=A0AAV8ZQS5_9CUCU|nr:hypothetical protein NQ314_002862 [Rhamnusium bicolor]